MNRHNEREAKRLPYTVGACIARPPPNEIKRTTDGRPYKTKSSAVAELLYIFAPNLRQDHANTQHHISIVQGFKHQLLVPHEVKSKQENDHAHSRAKRGIHNQYLAFGHSLKRYEH